MFRVKGKQVYLPMNDSKDAAINLLTSSYADKDTDTPYIIFTRPFPINPDTDLRLRVSVTEIDFRKRINAFKSISR
jgi:hypothetical protein